MKVLIINKFLYPNGGSETYIFKLGQELTNQGHEIQYFGMDHEKRCVGNRVNAYTPNMDFHTGNKITKLAYPFKTIYSSDARKKIRLVLDDFQPDVCHLNNFNYQLTPSIILEIRKWEKETGHNVKIVFTAHDYQLVCPNHMLNNPSTRQNCESCLGGHYSNCLKGKCIHGSTAKSFIGMLEAVFWNGLGVYEQIDTIICCSEFLKSKMDTNPVLAARTVALHNFVENSEWKDTKKEDYILYFGRFSEEKGLRYLIQAYKSVYTNKRLVIVGGSSDTDDFATELRELAADDDRILFTGFLSGRSLEEFYSNAWVYVLPSDLEGMPLSLLEAMSYGNCCLVSDIPECADVVEDHALTFQKGNVEDLKKNLQILCSKESLVRGYKNDAADFICSRYNWDDVTEKTLHLYRG